MVKDCRVKQNNKYMTVVDFDGVLVQLPAIHKDVAVVRVLYKDGTYRVVKDDYTEEKPSEKKTRSNKKTTVEQTTTDEIVEE